MGNLLRLSWWLALVAALQGSAFILDGSRHLFWGMLGFCVVKAVYLAFAWIVILRHRSFRRQRAFEALAESYHRVAGKDFDPKAARRESRLNPALNQILLALASADCVLAFAWNLEAWRVSILLDVAIGLLLIRWVARAGWLRARAARERLKSAVDDARSLARPQAHGPEAAPKRVSSIPFAALAALAMACTLGLGSWRWAQAQRAFRAGEADRCLEAILRTASERFYQQGQARFGVGEEPCVKALAGRVEFGLEWGGGELRARAEESGGSDYFGNGTAGDEGRVMDTNGRSHGLGARGI
jgi:hypothetical protein